MRNIPVTYYCSFPEEENLRRHLIQELADAGVKHIVFNEQMAMDSICHFGLAETLQKELADAGLSFCDAHAPFGPKLDLSCPYPKLYRQMIACHKLVLELCAFMNIDTITIHVGNNHFEEARNYTADQLIGRIKNSLAELLPLAEKLGISICIENIWLPINTPEVLNSIKADFPTDALGFCYDSGHANLMDKGRYSAESGPRSHWAMANSGEPVWDDQILEKMLPHVVNCHLHDNMGIQDDHILAGDGTIAWDHIMPLLLSAPRLKVIQSEVNPIRHQIPFRKMVARFDELLKLK